VRAYDFSPILENLSYSLVFEKENLRQLVQVREAMEVGLLAEVVKRLGDADLQDLQRAVDEMGGTDPKLWEKADYRFHQILYRCLENRLVLELIDVFWVVVHDLRDRHIIPAQEDRQREHRHILDLVRRRDEAGAIAAMRDHFSHIRARLAATPNRPPPADPTEGDVNSLGLEGRSL
jgi:DNA-binding FadR family transcriptional regulator